MNFYEGPLRRASVVPFTPSRLKTSDGVAASPPQTTPKKIPKTAKLGARSARVQGYKHWPVRVSLEQVMANSFVGEQSMAMKWGYDNRLTRVP